MAGLFHFVHSRIATGYPLDRTAQCSIQGGVGWQPVGNYLESLPNQPMSVGFCLADDLRLYRILSAFLFERKQKGALHLRRLLLDLHSPHAADYGVTILGEWLALLKLPEVSIHLHRNGGDSPSDL